MSRRGKKKGRPISGWVVLDKPVGLGSTEAVSKIKWLFNAEKAGHAGTLDPLASGMLPIALGEATKTVPYVMDGTKVYRFTIAWGEERTTDDLEGVASKTSDKRPSRDEVEALLPNYTGVIMQQPPAFSAIKVDGERAYDRARGGEEVELPSREVEIDRLEIIDHTDEKTTLEVECGKGTYVRSLARDLGRDLGCYGHVSDLRRIEVDPFTTEDFVTLDELEKLAPPRERKEAEKVVLAVEERDGEVVSAEAAPVATLERGPSMKERYAPLDGLLIETAAALDCLPEVVVSDEMATRLRLGNPIIVKGRDAISHADEAFATARGRLVAIGSVEAGMFRPKRVFTHS
ncbi:tRNA pseudouridine synthase B [Limoniibacter endophyticus]|uniref:tRNA pseudouridine synthase B n=1 Tax=Limoniibacter endophyticus TaxID=1565040 RepID=A0A8J3GGP2_9HYPH|nr:tRNA pseudouridine(55) synthase TruB [Limoniibacter endophyticus]GHC69827.1 tRNA pseudouridine synthase B [Limoniibacter endophyticus]